MSQNHVNRGFTAQSRSLAAVLTQAGPDHPWPDTIIANRFGNSRDRTSITKVTPTIVAEVDADTARQSGVWRHPLRFKRLRAELHPDDLPRLSSGSNIQADSVRPRAQPQPGLASLRGAFAVSALITSMAIDLDHVLLYAGVQHIADGGRPYSHSLATALVLGIAAATIRPWRPVRAGLATGVALHLVRDVSTGPGLVLFWPVSFQTVRLPYGPYLWVLVAVTIGATLRVRSGRRVF